jgi:hypothetical protein
MGVAQWQSAIPGRWFPGKSLSRSLDRLTLQRNAALENENMSLRKVYGGTPVGSESRCDTCTYARIIQGYAESEKIVFCNNLWDPIRIPFSVRQCSAYEDKRLPDVDEMKEIAWQIRTKSAGSVAGFVTVPEETKSQDEQTSADPVIVPAATKD